MSRTRTTKQIVAYDGGIIVQCGMTNAIVTVHMAPNVTKKYTNNAKQIVDTGAACAMLIVDMTTTTNNMNTNETKKRYTTSANMRAVLADSMHEAAGMFAERMSRKRYGKNGSVAALRQDCYSQDGAMAEYEAFVGRYDYKNHDTSGGNVRFSVYA